MLQWTNLFSFWLAIFQSCVAFPVLEVNFAKSPNNQLQLSLIKALEQLLWNELVEALLQGQKLGLNPVHKSIKNMKYLILGSLSFFVEIYYIDWENRQKQHLDANENFAELYQDFFLI